MLILNGSLLHVFRKSPLSLFIASVVSLGIPINDTMEHGTAKCRRQQCNTSQFSGTDFSMNNRVENQLTCAMILLVGSICGGATAQESQGFSTDQRVLFEEVSKLVAEHFYDRSFDISVWA